MSFKARFFAAFILLSLFAPQISSSQPYLTADWLWPTNASTLLSATFAETRSAHFHAGVDVKTWGREGYEVYASRDGIVHRIGISPYGYGRVVYLRHDDGSISLYAHLRDFSPKIRAVVDSLRLITFPFRFDEEMEKHNIHFRRGEIVAYSGSSGIGPPHLHFELRTPDNKPFNPLLTNIRVKDTTPPRISGIAIEPLSQDATVNGRHRITEITNATNQTYGPITVSGTIGIAVNASDYADGANNVYAAYMLELRQNDRLIFSSRADSFSYGNTSQMFLDRIFPILMQTRRGYQRLFVRDGNDLPLYTTDLSGGMLRFPVGSHTVQITAIDYAGNRTHANVRLNVVAPPAPPKTAALLAPSFPHPVEYVPPNAMAGLEWTNNGFSIPSADKNTTVDVCRQSLVRVFDGNTPCTRFHAEPGHFFDVRGSDQTLIRVGNRNLGVFHRITPGQEQSLYSTNGKTSVTFFSNSLYDTMSVSFSASVTENLRRAALWPTHEPLRTAAQLTWLLEPGEENLNGWGWAQVNGGRKSWMGTQLEGRRLISQTSRFGTFEVVRDTIPPEVTSPRLVKDHAGRPMVTVRVRDDLSGVHFETVQFSVDGMRGIIEYEPDASMLMWLHPGYTPRKGSRILVELADQAGNKTTFSAAIP